MINASTATINLSALQHNLSRVREIAAHSKVYAVIKSNAYGHGLIPLAKALSSADGLAVARVDEALALRQKAVKMPILVLGGVYDDVSLRRATAHGLELVIHHEAQLELLTAPNNVSGTRGMTFWIKIDTGMHRLGFAPEHFAQVYEILKTKTHAAQIHVITHLANADDPTDKRTKVQVQRLAQVAESSGLLASVANSAGIMAWPDTHAHFVRPGIMLYGASPLINKSAAELDLKPVMTLSSHLVAVRNLKKGDHVGYGGAWVCPENMRVGVVSIGYGDGYPRHAPSGTPVLVNGVRTQLVGRVSMDLICVDLRPCPQAQVKDEVILWGAGLPADEIARCAGTIAYELFCGVTQRVVFVYQDG